MNKKSTGMFLLLLFFAAISLFANDIIEEIVAIVNDEIITLSQYKAQHDALYRLLRSQYEGEEFEKQYAFMKKELLNSMITDLLLLQMAKEKGLNVRDQFRGMLDKLKEENHIGSDEELIREMQRQGIDFEEWRQQQEEFLLKQAVIFYEVDRNIVLEDSELINYYKLHPEDFTDPEEYKLRAIYISAEGREEAELEAKKKEISEKIAGGEDFASLASNYSEGPEKEHQGDLGSFKKGQLEKSLEQAVEKLPAGGTTPWLKVRNGWYLLKLEEKKESRLKTFEEAKKDIEEKLFQEKKQKLLNEFLTNLRERSYIKILKPNPLNF